MTKCKICGKSFSYKHLARVHKMSNTEYKKKFHLKSSMPNQSEKVRTANKTIKKGKSMGEKSPFISKRFWELVGLLKYKNSEYCTKDVYAEALGYSISKVNKDISKYSAYFQPIWGNNKAKQKDQFKLKEKVLVKDIDDMFLEAKEACEHSLDFLEHKDTAQDVEKFFNGKSFTQIIKAIDEDSENKRVGKDKEERREYVNREVMRGFFKRILTPKSAWGLKAKKQGSKLIFEVTDGELFKKKMIEEKITELATIAAIREMLYDAQGYIKLGGDKHTNKKLSLV